MQPTSLDPKFDFMLKNNQPAKRRLPMLNLPRPMKIVLGVVLVVIVLVVVSSVLSKHKGGSTLPVINAVARNQEILRVTAIVQTLLPLQDPTIQASAATVATTLSSEQQQLVGYLASSGVKVSKVQLAADTDKTSDSQLQTASQNNNLDQAYISYLQQALAKYQADLQTADKSVGPNGKVILKSAYDSTNTLLTTAPLKP